MKSLSEIVQRLSPLSLTEKGHKILEESGAKIYIDKNKNSLILEIREQCPKSLYDVQEFSKQIVDSHKNDDDFISIKDYAYLQGLELDHIIIGMMVYLRDYAFIDLGFQSSND